MLSYVISNSALSEREDAYKEIMYSLGLSHHIKIHYTSYKEHDTDIVNLLEKAKNRGVEAMFLPSSRLTIKALFAIKALNIRIPEDLAILGFDGTEICNFSEPNITQVKQSKKCLAERSFMTLKKLMDGENAIITDIIEPELCIGESTDPIYIDRIMKDKDSRSTIDNLTKKNSILIPGTYFKDKGGWMADPQFMEIMGSSYLMAHGLGIPVADAKTDFEVPASGEYNIYVRTRNWTKYWTDVDTPGVFKIKIDGKPLETVFGNEESHWHWQNGGQVFLTEGKHTITVCDLTGFNARFDSILISRASIVLDDKVETIQLLRNRLLDLATNPENKGKYDFVVVGGGIAGMCAAIASARKGLKVALIQDRKVLGGNNSSEVRVGLGGRLNIGKYPMKKILKIGIFFKIILILMLLGSSLPLQAQTKTVKGIVFDDDDQPMPGVAVYDPQNISGGTLTTDKGQFTINVSNNCKELEFSCIGFKTLRLPLSKTAIVKLEADTQTIEETVVTGIYTRKADSFTGAVQSITADNLKRVGNQNVFQSLKNIDPSLMILDNLSAGSDPNAMVSMQLRGASSFSLESATSLKSNFVNDTNMPLFILDGFETSVEKIQDMDMNRIQSITILKDASAKAIYGAKAGNGVIVIETKSLRSNETLITYNGNLRLEAPDLTSYNLCNALEKLEVEMRENYYSTSYPDDASDHLEYSELYYKRLKKALEGESTYWLSKPLRVGITHQHSLSAELGSKELKALATFQYADNQGAMKGSYRRNISGDINIAYRYGKWLFRNIMSISSMKNEDSPYGTFSEVSRLNPYATPYDEYGSLLKIIDVVHGVEVGNPLYNASLNTKFAKSYLDFTDNMYVEYQVVKPLKLVGRFSVSTKKTEMEDFYPADHTKFMASIWHISEDAKIRRGSYEMTNGNQTAFSGDFSAQFNHSFGKNHDLFATGQFTISETKYNEVTHHAEGFPNSRMNSIIYARKYAMDTTPTGMDGINRNLGLLLTTGYSYKDRYMLDATIRGSASSVFGTNKRWGTFWSLGLAWNLHNEEWMSSASWIQQLKIRGSLGSSGNQNYTTNQSLAVYRYFNDKYYDSFTGAILANMENPNLGWEQKMDYNIGLDFRIAALLLTADFYIADTHDMVFRRSLLPSTGFNTVTDNLGMVRNKGFEIGLNYRVFQKGSSWLSIFSKIAYNDNRVLEISEALETYNRIQKELAVETGSAEPVIQYYNGVPLRSIWAVRSLGIDPITGKEIFLDKDGEMTNNWSANNLVNCGSSDPKFNGNFGLSAEVKGIGLNIVCNWYGGGYMYNTTLVNKIENTPIGYNVDRRIFTDRWHYPGQNAQFRNGYGNGIEPTKATSRFVQKNNVLSLSSASLYYEFPYNLTKKMKMNRLRLSLYANDLYTFSSIKIERGTAYPYARSFSFSVTATF